MIICYDRVSTDRQTVENQRFEIEKYCKKHNITIDRYVSETVSGTKEYEQRELGHFIRQLRHGDIIICYDVSRLGRDMLMIMEIIRCCFRRGAKVLFVKQDFYCTTQMESNIMLFCFSMCAEVERELISERTKTALAKLRDNGVQLGRPAGVRCRLNPYCEEHQHEIIEMVALGLSTNSIAKKLQMSPKTLRRYLAYKNLRRPLNWNENDICR